MKPWSVGGMWNLCTVPGENRGRVMPSCFEHMRLVRPDKRLLTDPGVEFSSLYVDLKGEERDQVVQEAER
ncbi:MAG: hypothetical protein WBH88_06345 [Candidatus Methanoculleus thermohydrogenotrophicum]|nr:hypothetical protein [Candidatus Methanoculleus thermohydrogenotrophicum]HPZ37617.1 hypothetical protein [Candidatus Methanoculleus thermohydrogenotrophicum]